MKRRCFLLGTAVVLMGCASTGVLTLAVPPTVALKEFKTVSVKVDSNVAEASEEMKQLQTYLIAGLADTGRWQVVDARAELQLNATITELHKVGSGARVLLGAFAGQASVDLEVEVTDSKGAAVSKFKVTGKSSGGTIFAGTTDQALQQAAKEIVAFFQKQ